MNGSIILVNWISSFWKVITVLSSLIIFLHIMCLEKGLYHYLRSHRRKGDTFTIHQPNCLSLSKQFLGCFVFLNENQMSLINDTFLKVFLLLFLKNMEKGASALCFHSLLFFHIRIGQQNLRISSLDKWGRKIKDFHTFLHFLQMSTSTGIATAEIASWIFLITGLKKKICSSCRK